MKNDGKVIVRVDSYTRFCLTAIAVLLTVLIIGLWAETRLAGGSWAAEPFLGGTAQRSEMLDAQNQTNKKLDDLIKLFQTGQAKVQVLQADGQQQGAEDAGAGKAQ